jgi:hypothetical protein
MSGIGLVARAAAPVMTAWFLLVVPGYTEVVLVFSALGLVSLGAFWWAKPPRA